MVALKVKPPVPPAAQRWLARNRILYLRTLAGLAGKAVEIKMYDNVTMSGVYKASDPNGQKMFIANAELPMGGTLPGALLRNSDIISIQFDED